MATKRGKKKKIGTLAAKQLSADGARRVKGGITKLVDKSSAVLFQKCATGEHFGK